MIIVKFQKSTTLLCPSNNNEKFKEHFKELHKIEMQLENEDKKANKKHVKQMVDLGVSYDSLRNIITEDFLLINADAIFDIDFNRLVNYHKEKGGLVTIISASLRISIHSGLLKSPFSFSCVLI